MAPSTSSLNYQSISTAARVKFVRWKSELVTENSSLQSGPRLLPSPLSRCLFCVARKAESVYLLYFISLPLLGCTSLLIYMVSSYYSKTVQSFFETFLTASLSPTRTGHFLMFQCILLRYLSQYLWYCIALKLYMCISFYWAISPFANVL